MATSTSMAAVYLALRILWSIFWLVNLYNSIFWLVIWMLRSIRSVKDVDHSQWLRSAGKAA